MNALKNFPWLGVGFSILAGAVLCFIAYHGYGLSRIPFSYRRTPEIALPILVLGGAIVLLISLAFLAGAFASLELSDRRQALSLPEGSVRALIALFLITLFAITAIFLYRQLRSPLQEVTMTYYTGISGEQLRKIPEGEIIAIRARTEGDAGADVFDVDRRIPAVEASEESQRFAQQILTAVSTLVIAVAGFYFGNRSVAAARGAVAPSSPVIRGIDRKEGKAKETISVRISGRNFDSPKLVKLVAGAAEMKIEASSWGPQTIRGTLVIPEKQPAGSYDLIVVNADGAEDELPGAFTVTKNGTDNAKPDSG